jgi:hypothetical protein
MADATDKSNLESLVKHLKDELDGLVKFFDDSPKLRNAWSAVGSKFAAIEKHLKDHGSVT